MQKLLLTKRTGIIAACFTLLLIVGFIAYDEEPGFIEVERLKALERHSGISERARQDFEERYQELDPQLKKPETIFQELDLPQPSHLAPLPDGGQEARVEIPGKYACLVLTWDASREPREFAWEVESPASDEVSWEKHLASFEVGE